MSFETMAKKIVADSGKKLATAAELDALRKLQGEFDRAQASMNKYDIFSAYTAWDAHNSRLARVARQGAPHVEVARSRESFESDFLAKNEAGKIAMRAVCQEAVPLARGIAEKFASLANAAAAEAEKSEASVFSEWQQPYAPSQLILTLRGIADQARRRVPSSEYATVAPAGMVPFLSIT
jgi:hypothetical protein